MAQVTVVGSYIVALVMDVDRIPVPGETLIGRNYHTTHGGKGSNMAVAAARLGAASTFVGKIGRDATGEGFRALLAEEGVDPAGLLVSTTQPTATGIILFATGGSNAIIIDPGANNELSPVEVTAALADLAPGAVTLSPLEIPLASALAGARAARLRGGRAILNPAPAQDLRGSDLGDVFALTPNETEARVCLGLAPTDPTPPEKLAEQLLALGPTNVIVTLGGEGVLWVSATGARRIPALRVQVLDTVGAGDAFNAGLAVGIAEGRPLAEAIAIGVTAASLSTEKRETIASYPGRREVNARLAEVLTR